MYDHISQRCEYIVHLSRHVHGLSCCLVVWLLVVWLFGVVVWMQGWAADNGQVWVGWIMDYRFRMKTFLYFLYFHASITKQMIDQK